MTDHYRPFVLPRMLRERVEAFRDGHGSAWLGELPRIVGNCRRRWSLTLGPPFVYPSLSYVAPATRADGSSAVLKVGFLLDELADEIAALEHCGGQGTARLLGADADSGALLIERLHPGGCLADLGDDVAATSIVAGVMRDFWRTPPETHRFPTVADWCRGFGALRARYGGGTGPLPRTLVERAEGLAGDLLASSPAPMLLHGDLQHYNVLSAERRPWLAIDPKGVVGDPAFEAAPYLRNCRQSVPDPAAFLERRVSRLADALGMDRARIRGWGVVGAVLSAWWSLEDDGSGWEDAIECARLLAAQPD